MGSKFFPYLAGVWIFFWYIRGEGVETVWLSRSRDSKIFSFQSGGHENFAFSRGRGTKKVGFSKTPSNSSLGSEKSAPNELSELSCFKKYRGNFMKF